MLNLIKVIRTLSFIYVIEISLLQRSTAAQRLVSCDFSVIVPRLAIQQKWKVYPHDY